MKTTFQQTCLAVAACLAVGACATDVSQDNPGNAAPGAVLGVPAQPARAAPVAVGKSNSAAAAQAPRRGAADLPKQRSVYYDLDHYEIKPEFRNAVEGHASYLRENAQAHVTIQGNGDERGSREYNLALGQKRAESVRQMMRLSGARDQQIETVSFGEEKPRATGHDEASWAENRRSDLVYGVKP
jgi:peptidoglycan-associated lipoprotein